jgi:hypothetical protein
METQSQSLVTSAATNKVKAPAAITHSCVWEFQVFYFHQAGPGPHQAEHGPAEPAYQFDGNNGRNGAHGELRSMLVRAETAAQARWHLEQAGLEVSSVGTGRPVIDWSKPYFTRDEAEVFCIYGSTGITKLIESGKLKRVGDRAVFSRAALERAMEG